MAQFTRRDYIWLASAARDMINHFPVRQDRTTVKEAIRVLAECLQAESPGFDKEQFFHNAMCDPTHHNFGVRCPFTDNPVTSTSETCNVGSHDHS